MNMLIPSRCLLFASPQEIVVHLMKKPAASLCVVATPDRLDERFVTALMELLYRQSIPVTMRSDRP